MHLTLNLVFLLVPSVGRYVALLMCYQSVSLYKFDRLADFLKDYLQSWQESMYLLAKSDPSFPADFHGLNSAYN